MEEVKAKEELSKKRTENIKIRRRLGFIDLQADENGNLVEIPDEQGVDDELMDKLNLKKARWEKTVEEERERKPMQIVTPISGISKDEYKDGMLRSDEYFKDQWAPTYWSKHEKLDKDERMSRWKEYLNQIGKCFIQ